MKIFTDFTNKNLTDLWLVLFVEIMLLTVLLTSRSWQCARLLVKIQPDSIFFCQKKLFFHKWLFNMYWLNTVFSLLMSESEARWQSVRLLSMTVPYLQHLQLKSLLIYLQTRVLLIFDWYYLLQITLLTVLLTSRSWQCARLLVKIQPDSIFFSPEGKYFSSGTFFRFCIFSCQKKTFFTEIKIVRLWVGYIITDGFFLWNPSGSSVKIGTIQRRLAWPLRKDDTHKSRMYHFFLPVHNRTLFISDCGLKSLQNHSEPKSN